MKKLLTALFSIVVLFSLCVAAVTLDTVENATEVTVDETAALQSTEVDIPLYDPTYGKLVYYNNFESLELGDVDTEILDYSYCNTGFIDVANRPIKIGEINQLKIVEDPINGVNKVLKVVNESTGRQNPQLWIAQWGDFAAVGTYTLVFDVTSSVAQPIKLRYTFDSAGNTGSAETVLTTTANEWLTGAKSYELVSYAEDADGNYKLKNGWMHSDYTVASDADPDIASYYIDNVRVYYLPKGYVTTEALNIPEKADGTSETVYQTPVTSATPEEVIFDETTKKYVSLKDSYYIPGYAFLGWYDVDGNKLTTDTFNLSSSNAPKDVYGRWQKLGPGLNMLTGTTDVADFENGSTNNIGFRFNESNIGIREVVDNSVIGGGEGNITNVLRTKGIWTYHHMFVPGVFESGRKYEIKYDAYYSAAPLGQITTFHSWIINTGSTINHTQYGNSAENKAGKWYSGSQSFTPDNSVDYLEIQTKISADAAGSQPDYTYQYIYFDNMAVTPYYKVTYVDVDGTETVAYVLYDAEGKLLTSYTPDAANFASGATTYKLSADGEIYDINTPITLANEDVTIYATADSLTPATSDEKEIRIDVNGEAVTSSIRFKASVTASQLAEAEEIGFIATRQTFLDEMAKKAVAGEEVETELTFDFVYGEKVMYVSGVAYKVENGVKTVEILAGVDENGSTIISTALTGIDNAKAEEVNEVLVTRPYIKYVNGDKEFVFYGKTASASLVEVAKNVDTSGLPATVQDHIAAIEALETKAE